MSDTPDSDALCAICDSPATDTCPRCARPRCERHRRVPGNSWPETGYQVRDLCMLCAGSVERGSRKVGRVIVAASAAVLGAALSAVLVLMIGAPLGLGADITVLTMLVAEILGGGGAAYLADRRMQRWLLERDQHELPDLPQARLLPPRSDSGAGTKAGAETAD